MYTSHALAESFTAARNATRNKIKWNEVKYYLCSPLVSRKIYRSQRDTFNDAMKRSQPTSGTGQPYYGILHISVIVDAQAYLKK